MEELVHLSPGVPVDLSRGWLQQQRGGVPGKLPQLHLVKPEVHVQGDHEGGMLPPDKLDHVVEMYPVVVQHAGHGILLPHVVENAIAYPSFL